jgi:hypothetical protein
LTVVRKSHNSKNIAYLRFCIVLNNVQNLNIIVFLLAFCSFFSTFATAMEETIKDFEIMAPVGSRDALAAALKAGADSGYFGV